MKIRCSFSMRERTLKMLKELSDESGFSQSDVLEILVEVGRHDKLVPKDLGDKSMNVVFRKALERQRPGFTVTSWCKYHGIGYRNLQQMLRRMSLGEAVGVRPNTDSQRILELVEGILEEDHEN